MKEEVALESAKGVLQDLVVVVSLVRTLTDSFGSATDLYRKLKRKSKSIVEDGEDELEEKRHRPLQRRRDSDSDEDGRRHRHHIRFSMGRSRSRSKRRKDDSDDSDEESIRTSSSLVRAEYDRGYQYLGERYARGDLITQNQLQSQIITLQQTLLDIYQDITVSSYLSPSSSYSHLSRLLQTTRAARTASIQALSMQYQRMQSHTFAGLPESLPHLPGTFPVSSNDGTHELVIRRRKSSRTRDRSRSSSSDTSSAKDRSRPIPKPIPRPISENLFCVYASDLQNKHRLPLADNYKAGGDNCCPFCHSHIATRPNKAWEIVKEDEKRRELDRTFFIGNRFVVKCHREGGGFACVLCRRCRETDTACGEIRALIEHLWREHTCAELELDEDVEEIR